MTGVLNIGRWIERWSILYFLKSSVCDKNVRATSKQILCICRHTHEQRKQRQKNGKRPIRPKKKGGGLIVSHLYQSLGQDLWLGIDCSKT